MRWTLLLVVAVVALIGNCATHAQRPAEADKYERVVQLLDDIKKQEAARSQELQNSLARIAQEVGRLKEDKTRQAAHAEGDTTGKLASVEVKNNWTKEVTLVLNGKKYKVPAGDSKSVALAPGEFTYQIEGVTGEITKKVAPGKVFSLVVRPTAAEGKESNPAPARATGTLVLISRVAYSVTVIVNDSRHAVAPGETVRVEVPAGSVRSQLPGGGPLTTECPAGGESVVSIRDAAP
jgi:hypothetical protein